MAQPKQPDRMVPGRSNDDSVGRPDHMPWRECVQLAVEGGFGGEPVLELLRDRAEGTT